MSLLLPYILYYISMRCLICIFVYNVFLLLLMDSRRLTYCLSLMICYCDDFLTRDTLVLWLLSLFLAVVLKCVLCDLFSENCSPIDFLSLESWLWASWMPGGFVIEALMAYSIDSSGLSPSLIGWVALITVESLSTFLPLDATMREVATSLS